MSNDKFEVGECSFTIGLFKRANGFLLGVGATLLAQGLLAVLYIVVSSYQFEKNYVDHIEAAMQSQNFMEMAGHFRVALEYLEEEGLTEGNTGVFTRKPENSISQYYRDMLGHLEYTIRAARVFNSGTGGFSFEQRQVGMDWVKRVSNSSRIPDGMGWYPYQWMGLFLLVILATGVVFTLTSLYGFRKSGDL